MTEYAIQAQNVVKKFGDFTAINNITLNVPKG
ncbi:ABC transporter ATP-binding protein, partial [Vibrio parahaemolyticus]|nr:ABC transporter ATP-binding protein [Vibrio parahaemolyticus]